MNNSMLLFNNLFDEIDDFMYRSSSSTGNGKPFPYSNCDICREDGTCFLDISLAGVKKDRVSITTQGNKLYVDIKSEEPIAPESKPETVEPTKSAKKSTKTENANAATPCQKRTTVWHNIKSMGGEFHLAYEFPKISDLGKVKADLNDGILSIVVPADENQIRKNTIKIN